MTWTLILVLIAFAIYALYNVIVVGTLGLPWSLSETFYRLKAKKEWLRFFFPIMMMLTSWLLLPAWLEISAPTHLEFLAFFAAAGIMFTGAAPAFKKHSLENMVHTISALVSALFAILWIIFVSKLWWVLIAWLVLITLIAVITKTWKTSPIFWLETVAFLATFTSIILYHLI